MGDLVLVKLQPYRQQSLAQRFSFKLSQRFYGPYKVIKKISGIAYTLELPVGSRIHPTFHVSPLKKFIGNLGEDTSQSPLISVDNQPILYPLAILDSRIVLGGCGSTQRDLADSQP